MKTQGERISPLKIEFLFWVAIAAALAILYGKLIALDPILNYDDKILLVPIRDLHSLSDYWKAVQSGRIFDVQPVRDLSFWLDFQIQKWIPFASFHLTNVLLWLGSLAVIRLILAKLNFSRWACFTTVALYATHPVFMNSVAWIAARKHVLSTFFILCATYLIIEISRSQRLTWTRVFGLSSLYFLAIFSHPINVLWPVFAIAYLWGHTSNPFKTAQGRSFALLCVLLGGTCIYLNVRYYNGIYVLQSGGSGKYADNRLNNLGIQLLAFGRYFFQVICPVWPCVSSPYPGSLQNIIGLCTFPLFALGLKKCQVREIYYWMLYYILPLIPLLLKMTNIFVSDTYLLNASLGIFIALGYTRWTQVFPQQWRHSRWMAFASVCSLFFILSFQLSSAWESDLKLWKNSYSTEATPANTTNYGEYLLRSDEPQKALELALRVKDWQPQNPDLPNFFSQSIYKNPDFTLEQKISVLKDSTFNSPWHSYYLAALYASKGDFGAAFQEIRSQLGLLDRFIWDFQDQLEIVTAELYYFCQKSGEKGCSDFQQKLQNHLESHHYLRIKRWSQESFMKRLRELEKPH